MLRYASCFDLPLKLKPHVSSFTFLAKGGFFLADELWKDGLSDLFTNKVNSIVPTHSNLVDFIHFHANPWVTSENSSL